MSYLHPKFVCWAPVVLGLTLFVCPAFGSQGTAELRQYSGMNFQVDAEFLRAGNVQYFFGMVKPDGSALVENSAVSAGAIESAFQALLKLDHGGVWSKQTEPELHALVSRVAYIAPHPISFFSADRVTDATFINAVSPNLQVRAEGGPSFSISGSTLRGIPSARLDVEHFTALALPRASHPAAAALHLPGVQPKPGALVWQRTYDFGRIMGMRTSEENFSATLHYELSAGETLVVNYSLGYLYTLPPVSPARVVRNTAIDYTSKLIANLQRRDL